MSSNASGDSSRMTVTSQTVRTESLARYGVLVPMCMGLPHWAVIPYAIFALLIPQESADRLAWWDLVLSRSHLTCGSLVAGFARRRVRATPASTKAMPTSTATVTLSPRTNTPSTIATTGSR
jgi:hypothetical protein